VSASLRHHLLIAAPQLGDPNFERTVVYVIDHSVDGAFGVVLNRPAAIEVAHQFPEFADRATPDGLVLVGGPVQTDVVLVLARVGDEYPRLVDTADLRSSGDTARLRFVIGYTGWGPRQLDDEIGEQAWFVVPARGDEPFADPTTDRWREALGRLPDIGRMLARFPDDPSVN